MSELINAAANGNIKKVQELIKAGADLDIANDKGHQHYTWRRGSPLILYKY